MFPGMNSRQAKQMMKKMGIAQQELDAIEVIIRCPDKEIVISDPSVAKVNMMGQETFQISGNITERSPDTIPTISPEDIKTVMEQASCTEEEAEKAIQEHDFDLAEAIMSLNKEE